MQVFHDTVTRTTSSLCCEQCGIALEQLLYGLFRELSVYVQARSELVKLYVKESNSLPVVDFQAEEQQALMGTALKYCKLTVDAKERVCLRLPVLDIHMWDSQKI